MAGVSISGDNSSYTVGLTMADSTFRYHVFIADISTTGSILGYYCRRSSLGVAGTTWTYHGTSSSPYSNYKRRVIVRTSKSATSHSVGGYYSYSEVTSGTNSYYDGYIPAAKSTTYTYYLYYNANGGSGAPATQSSGSTTNTGWTFTISSTEPTRSGYTFLGWATSSTATSASYQPGDTIRRTSSSPSITLYAVWSEETYTYYFRTIGGVNYWVYKNGSNVIMPSNTSGILSISVKKSDTITVCSPTTSMKPSEAFSNGKASYAIWTGYTTPIYIYFDGSDSLFQNTTPTDIESDHTVSWKGRNRRIQLQATGIKVGYYFRCMTGVSYYTVYRNGSSDSIMVHNSDDYVVLPNVTVNDVVTVGTSSTTGTPTVAHTAGYESPDYIYFDKGDGKYQSTDPTDLQDDHVVSWKGYSRYIQVRATLGATKYRIHAFGNGGTINGADDIYSPTMNSWYETTGVTVEFNVSNLPTPVRDGYTFNGWAQWSSSDSGVITGTVMVNASVDGTTNNLYATWKKNQISLFYWDGASSEANSNDKLLIATGEPVGNITGGQNGNWNRLKAKIAELRKAQGGSWSYSTVSSGAPVTAAEFNDVRSGIDACDGHGTLPSAVSQNSIIYAHYFQSTTNNPNSLKSAINTAITNYNTT